MPQGDCVTGGSSLQAMAAPPRPSVSFAVASELVDALGDLGV